ncbi:MAG TPA: IPT/TIG domain-containing protein, partial [Planctomycetota bacterium]|nr:IPT/TIG domain-containing protein [Planctomycetota bacterium]
MKTLSRILAAAGLAGSVALVASLSQPVQTAAFSTIGGSLGTLQRDFRVFNNFTDATANNNTTPQTAFPGQLGAVMAIWKGHVEWASEPYAGTGAWDGASSNPVLGSGGANFDNTFQGTATTSGGTNDNVHSELAGSSGGVLAFTETPISTGWRIFYYSSWTWQDGPGSVSSGIDLQGVACHEIGHTLGLGHSSVGGATMFASISGTGTGQRSIEADDIAGIQSIYGVKSATKPHIGSLGGSKDIGGNLIINGSNFTATDNEVWFTKASGDGVPVKVLAVPSTAGGTVINVTVPAGIMDGDVLVKALGTGGASLSNAWPMDIGAPAGDPPVAVSINPTSGPAGGFTPVTITGTGFTGVTQVTFDGVPAESFTVNSNTQISAVTPPGTLLAAADVTVSDPEGSSTLTDAYIYMFNPNPAISAVTPNVGGIAGGTEVTITGASVVGVTSVTFGGVPGTNLEIDSATQLTVVTPAHAPGAVDVTANGAGSSTIVGGYTYVDTGSFVNLGPGKGGVLGVPVLSGTGDLSAGSGTGFTLQLSNAFPMQPITLFVSLSAGSVPFKGGTFIPVPIITSLSFTSDVFGGLTLPAAMPAGTPSLSFVLQYWCADPIATFGLSGSNGLQCIM